MLNDVSVAICTHRSRLLKNPELISSLISYFVNSKQRSRVVIVNSDQSLRRSVRVFKHKKITIVLIGLKKRKIGFSRELARRLTHNSKLAGFVDDDVSISNVSQIMITAQKYCSKHSGIFFRQQPERTDQLTNEYQSWLLNGNQTTTDPLSYMSGSSLLCFFFTPPKVEVNFDTRLTNGEDYRFTELLSQGKKTVVSYPNSLVTHSFHGFFDFLRRIWWYGLYQAEIEQKYPQKSMNVSQLLPSRKIWLAVFPVFLMLNPAQLAIHSINYHKIPIRWWFFEVLKMYILELSFYTSIAGKALFLKRAQSLISSSK